MYVCEKLIPFPEIQKTLTEIAQIQFVPCCRLILFDPSLDSSFLGAKSYTDFGISHLSLTARIAFFMDNPFQLPNCRSVKHSFTQA